MMFVSSVLNSISGLKSDNRNTQPQYPLEELMKPLFLITKCGFLEESTTMESF